MSAPAPSSRSADSYRRLSSPVLRSAWLLRASVLVAVAATALGVVVVPGLRSNASDATVLLWERACAVASVGAAVLISALATTGAFDLARAAKLGLTVRLPCIALTGVALILGIASAAHSLPPLLLAPMMLASTALAMIAAQVGLRASHTRAPALVLLGAALASTAHLFAWELANLGADRPALYTWARALATVALGLTALSQLMAATWISARGRGMGQLGALLATGAAMALVWAAARGASSDAPIWQSSLHTALHGSPTPRPFLIDSLPAFFTLTSMTLALAVALVPRQVTVLTATAALALVGRGELDVPMSTLTATAGSIWLLLAAADERVRWGDLMSARVDSRAQ